MACIYTAKYLYTGDAPPIAGGALLDLDGRIEAVGKLSDLKTAYPAVEIIDYPDAVLVPLLVNAHTHLELTDFPKWAERVGETKEPDSFIDWILRLIRVKRKLSKKAYNQSLANGIQQSIAAGTGAVGDVLSQYSCRKAYLNSTLHGVLFLESLGQDPAVIHKFRQELSRVLAEERVGGMSLGVSPHSPYTISADYLSDLYTKCRRQNLPCTTHLAESAAEVEFLRQGTGDLASKLYPFVGWEYLVPRAARVSPAEYLQQHGGLFPGNLLVHGVQLTTDEIALLREQKMSLALCPRSNAALNVGQPPIAELLTAGVRLCLGTDSLASNTTLSIWDELAFAHNWFDGAVDGPTLFRIATLDGAEALGLARQLGSLSVNKLTAFQVLQPETRFAEGELFDYLISPGRTAEIAQVYQRGKPCLSVQA